MTDGRVVRGRQTQTLLAVDWYQPHGWPDATAVPASLPGRDITGMRGLAPEVKATRGGPGTPALRQAAKNAGPDLPFVVYRPPGYGLARIAEWHVLMTLKNHTELLIRAGFVG